MAPPPAQGEPPPGQPAPPAPQRPPNGNGIIGPPAARYSTVFDSLVRGHDDLVGLVAYSLYKIDKRNWLVIQIEERNGQRPSEAELIAYSRTIDEAHRLRLRAQAETMMIAFSTIALEANVEQIQRDAISNDTHMRHLESLHAQQAVTAAIEHGSSFARNVAANIAANIALAGIVALAVISLILVPGLEDAIRTLFKARPSG